MNTTTVCILLVTFLGSTAESFYITCDFQYTPRLNCLIVNVTIEDLKEVIFYQNAESDRLAILEMDFIDSKIKSIPYDLFTNFVNLQVLTIEEANLDFIDELSFKGASNLIDLSLRYNNIEVIPVRVLRNCQSLIAANFEYNLIKEISAEAFEGATSLTELYLGNNKISVIQNLTFSSLVNLVVLRLSHNLIVEIDSNLFSNQVKLQKLYLNGNQLKYLEPGLFKALVHLEVISLDFNKIEVIENIFNTNEKLIFISFANNQIKRIDPNLTVNLKNKAYCLDLRENVCVNRTFKAADDNKEALWLTNCLSKREHSWKNISVVLKILIQSIYNF